jgi:hypothetical protein
LVWKVTVGWLVCITVVHCLHLLIVTIHLQIGTLTEAPYALVTHHLILSNGYVADFSGKRVSTYYHQVIVRWLLYYIYRHTRNDW